MVTQEKAPAIKWVCFIKSTDYLRDSYISCYKSISGVTNCGLSDISDNDKFVANIKYAHVYEVHPKQPPLLRDSSDLSLFFKTIAPAVNQNRCLLFIDTCCWPFSTAIQTVDTFNLFLFLKKMGIRNKDNVVLITSLHNSERDKKIVFKTVFWEFFESALRHCNVESISVSAKLNNFICNKKTYRFLYLNHKERIHRLYLFVKIFLLIKKGYKKIAASMRPCSSLFNYTGSKKALNFNRFMSEIPYFKKGDMPEWFFNSTEEKFINEFRKLTFINNKEQPTSISTSLIPFALGNKWRSIEVQWLHSVKAWEHVGIYIGVETNYFYSRDHAQQGNDYLTLTEKTFKPLMMKTPFILYGQPFILKKLKEYGYMTFESLWDESYDDEIDPALRADKIAELVRRLVNISDEEFTKILINTRDIVEYNYRVFMTRKPEEGIRKIISEFYAEKN
jgi:hypothetical protein